MWHKSLFLCAVLLLTPSLVLAAPIGKVTKMSGSGFYRVKDNIPYSQLKKGQDLNEGNWVKTGKDGWMELVLSDNSTFTIANNSELELSGFMVSKTKKEGTFNLTQGKLRASVVKLGGQQTNLKVKSRTAVAGIKGTEFLMLSEGPANVFFGNEGTVTVTGSGPDSAALEPGAMTQTTRGYNPTDPIMVESGTPLAQARTAFEASTAAVPPSDWVATDNLASIIARWNINHGHYLADSGKNDLALKVFQIALDLTKDGDIRADARLERGSVYSRFLANPESALAEYLLVLEEYPKSPQAETALFIAGQTLSDMNFREQARQRFKEYLQNYPEGKFRSSVETILNHLND